MTELDVVMERLEQYAKRFDGIENSIKEVSETLKKVAVQDERILNIDSKTTKLFRFHDEEFGPDGVVSKIQQHQSQCPKEEVKIMKSQQFKILIGLIFAYISGTIGIIAALVKG